jgi:hypothetical protein
MMVMKVATPMLRLGNLYAATRQLPIPPSAVIFAMMVMKVATPMP